MQHVPIAMKSSAVFTLILVSAVATASAQPEPAEPSGRVSYTDSAAAAKPAAAQQSAGEVQLADPTPANHGTEFIVVGKDAGSFSQLRLAATSGKVTVRRVRIFFADGTQRAVDVDSVLATGRDARVDLNGAKAIDRVTVATDTGPGSYALYGTAASGNVSGRGLEPNAK
jgi:hypothetical protein